MAEDVLLGGDVLRHILVHIQVVGRKVGDHGDVGALGHGHELEAGKLQHSVMVGLHRIRLAQQRVADVAAQPDGFAGGTQQLRDDGGGGGLAVRSGNGDDGTGTDSEEDLHLAGQLRPFGHRRRDLRHIGPQAGCAEDHVRVQAVQVVPAKVQSAATALQIIGLCAHLFPGALVAGGDGHALRQQPVDERRVADTDADNGHLLIFYGVYIFPQGHGCSLLG